MVLRLRMYSHTLGLPIFSYAQSTAHQYLLPSKAQVAVQTLMQSYNPSVNDVCVNDVCAEKKKKLLGQPQKKLPKMNHNESNDSLLF